MTTHSLGERPYIVRKVKDGLTNYANLKDSDIERTETFLCLWRERVNKSLRSTVLRPSSDQIGTSMMLLDDSTLRYTMVTEYAEAMKCLKGVKFRIPLSSYVTIIADDDGIIIESYNVDHIGGRLMYYSNIGISSRWSTYSILILYNQN